MFQMLQTISRVWNGTELNAADLAEAVRRREIFTGQLFFQAGSCPYSKRVRLRGVVTRRFKDTRQDN